MAFQKRNKQKLKENDVLSTVVALCTCSLLVIILNSNHLNISESLSRPRRSNSEDVGQPIEQPDEEVAEGYEAASEADKEADSQESSEEHSSVNAENMSELAKAYLIASLTEDYDDSYVKGNKKKKKKGNKNDNSLNLARLTTNSIKSFLSAINKVDEERYHKFEVQLETLGAKYGKPGEVEAVNIDYFRDYSRTTPQINEFLKEFGCENEISKATIWSGNANTVHMYYMIPNAIPTFSKDPINEYKNYINFIRKLTHVYPDARKNKNFRFSVGTYFTSGSVKYNQLRKYKGEADFDKSNTKFENMALTAGQFQFTKILNSAKNYIKTKSQNSPFTGDSCVIHFFIDSVPRDLDQMIDESYIETVNELNTICMIVPIFIHPSTETNRDSWSQFASLLIPGLEFKYANDPDYAGYYMAKSVSDLHTNNDLQNHINNYLCLMKNRALCRLCTLAIEDTAATLDLELSDEYAEDDFRAVDYNNVDSGDYEATDAPTTTAGPDLATTTGKMPEIDSCCGPLQYIGEPYSQDLKTCCSNGQTLSYKFEGVNPC